MKATQAKQSTDRINVLNIGLMLLSGLLAFVSPFYLFLIAYAVLGPLHYLTEISWLHDRGYYTGRKYDYLFLLAIGLLYGSSLLIHYDQVEILANAILVGFLGSLALAMTTNLLWRAVLLAAGCVFAYCVPISLTTVILGMLLLTMIHVFVFTGLFIAFGAMKSHSRTGYVSLAVFLGVGALLFLYQPMPAGGIADAFVIQHYDKAFGDLNIWFMRAFGLSTRGAFAMDPFEFSPGAIAVMRFIAFAYLYHYLNWFSKTKIIRWHEVSKVRLSAVVAIWAGAIVLYLIDYDLGIKALFFLSALHVLLEFPLDFRTIFGIGSEIGKRVKFGESKLIVENG